VTTRSKWTKKGHKKNVETLKAAGKDYAVEKRNKKVAALQRKVR